MIPNLKVTGQNATIACVGAGMLLVGWIGSNILTVPYLWVLAVLGIGVLGYAGFRIFGK